MMRRAIEHQTVVITGASSGIGRCTAIHLAKRGARVVLTGRRGDVLEDLAQQITESGGDSLAVPGDVTSQADMRAVASAAVGRYGAIDTWVNNAGVYIQGRLHEIALDEYRRVLDVNLIGVINGTQCALEVMVPRRSGVIIQVSSIAARRGVPLVAPYSAAKAALDGFTAAARAEYWGSGIHFSILYPPTVDTPVFHHSRGKLGVIPKPAPPVADPMQAARAIEQLAKSGDRFAYFGWAGPLALLNALSARSGDWLVHRMEGFTYSDVPSHGDNLDAPSATVPPAIRAGWSKPGWKGLTAHEMVRVLPLETLVGASVFGFLAGCITKHLRTKHLRG